MSIIEKATAQMEAWAGDDSHGYDQTYRWGEKGDFDCSAAVIQAWELAGVPVKSKGATYTGNMYSVFLNCGFEDVSGSVDLVHGSGLQRGDVLLNHKNHTAIYAGGGKTVEAAINERGTTTGGEPGDQTGKEFLLRLYRNYPWDCVLRYTGKSGGSLQPVNALKLVAVKVPQLQLGHAGAAVAMMQQGLKYHGHDPNGNDGEFGPRTDNALIAFQTALGLEPDGICGPATWTALMEG